MSDELRSAAKRLLLGPRAYRGTGYSAQLDIQKLADACLAEHPADDEHPIGEEWLVSIGGQFQDVPFRVLFSRQDALPICFHCVCDGWKAVLQFSTNGWFDLVRGLKTRGDVRRLCKALGVELKEQA